MGAWEIYTYGGGDTLLQLFNGLVAILGDNNFLVLLKLTALITVIWVIIEALFMKRPLSIQPFLVVILVFYILFLPRVNVIVTDRIDPSNSGVVANVPIGLGFTASMASTAGDWMSRAFETVFTLPNDLQYTTNGLLFGSNMLRAASQFEITDSRLAGNISEFMQQCVFYDILTGFYTWGDIVNEPDLWNMLRTSANPARSFQYLDASNTKSIVTCPAGAALLDADWANELTQAQTIYGNRMFPGDPLANAKFMAALPISYSYMSNIATTAADAIRQNMMSNAVKRSLTRFAARSDASAAAQDLALAQAEAQRSASYSVLGELAGETLPLLRNVFEVLIYGLFPMFLILMFTPAAGKALMFYLKSLFWLQLWAPLYALLNLIMTSYSANTGEAVATLPAGGQELTLATTTALGAVNADISAIASYMAWMIPLISWGVVNAGMGMSMSMLAAGLGSITQQAGSRAAADVSHGNIGMGNTSMYNQNAFKTDMAPAYAGGVGTMTDGKGTMITATPSSGQYEQFAQSNFGFGVQMTNAMRSGINTQLSDSQQSLW
ncbi:MAG: conjugal transfer protein TraG N-terminal domain-containing protein, partial [Candidatus Thiodiazotropha endolucinida]